MVKSLLKCLQPEMLALLLTERWLTRLQGAFIVYTLHVHACIHVCQFNRWSFPMFVHVYIPPSQFALMHINITHTHNPHYIGPGFNPPWGPDRFVASVVWFWKNTCSTPTTFCLCGITTALHCPSYRPLILNTILGSKRKVTNHFSSKSIEWWILYVHVKSDSPSLCSCPVKFVAASNFMSSRFTYVHCLFYLISPNVFTDCVYVSSCI